MTARKPPAKSSNSNAKARGRKKPKRVRVEDLKSVGGPAEKVKSSELPDIPVTKHFPSQEEQIAQVSGAEIPLAEPAQVPEPKKILCADCGIELPLLTALSKEYPSDVGIKTLRCKPCSDDKRIKERIEPVEEVSRMEVSPELKAKVEEFQETFKPEAGEAYIASMFKKPSERKSYSPPVVKELTEEQIHLKCEKEGICPYCFERSGKSVKMVYSGGGMSSCPNCLSSIIVPNAELQKMLTDATNRAFEPWYKKIWNIFR